MEFLDNFALTPTYLSKEFQLFRPDLEHTVSGVFPELIERMNIDYTLPKEGNFASHPEFAKKLDESFPSGFDTIIFLICDAVGVQHLSEMGGPLYDNLLTQGTIATSCFPTMTATVMTSLSYGKAPSQHGVVGYNYYNEYLDEVWNGLNLMTLDQNQKETMALDLVGIEQLVNGDPIMELVNQVREVHTSFLTPVDLVSPGLDDLLTPNLERQIYESPDEATQQVLQQLNQDMKNQVIALYIPYADHFGHYHGPESEEYQMAIRGIEQTITAIQQHPKVQNGSALIALTSDHGQSQIDHDISRWMNKERWQYHRDQGITLSTSGRTIHAYCDDDKLDDATSLLTKLADGRGMILDQDLAIELAGGVDTPQIRRRIGKVLMTKEDGYLHDIPEIVQYGADTRLHGQHGGMTSKELFVPVGLFGGQ